MLRFLRTSSFLGVSNATHSTATDGVVFPGDDVSDSWFDSPGFSETNWLPATQQPMSHHTCISGTVEALWWIISRNSSSHHEGFA
jgi:hypothetical protein